MVQCRYRLQARHYGHVYPRLAAFFNEVEVFVVVEEHLCDDISRPEVDFLLQRVHVALWRHSLVMLLRVSRHAVCERTLALESGVSVPEEQLAVVEAVDEFAEL